MRGGGQDGHFIKKDGRRKSRGSVPIRCTSECSLFFVRYDILYNVLSKILLLGNVFSRNVLPYEVPCAGNHPYFSVYTTYASLYLGLLEKFFK
jgi:hypothetical protein